MLSYYPLSSFSNYINISFTNYDSRAHLKGWVYIILPRTRLILVGRVILACERVAL